MSFRNSKPFGIILSLCLPGLGHIYWRELIFGLFIFLVTLIAIVLFFVSFLVPFQPWIKGIMIGLPFIFYLFTFVDLWRTMDGKRRKIVRSTKTALIFLSIGVLFQFLVPIAPVNFLLRNHPEFFMQEDNSVSPLFSKGDFLKASRLEYSADLFFLDKRILHALPDRYEIIRFVGEDGADRTGIVIGLPGEEIEVLDNTVIVNGMPDWNGPPGWPLNGAAALTLVDGYSILVVTLKFGVISETYQVTIDNLIGKVSKLP
ncbi:MAG: hypothetical protein P1R58_11415 [bacterium]|nr:hypothetical protein [bacterium]